ncbi:hypothetical protein [Kitasatospora sp. NPDC057198]|uniref:hypothetical protein n=1 Tax=Kitasatospora sp. NPDC057198 TaxID=3346046 RepID=UPI00362CCB8F
MIRYLVKNTGGFAFADAASPREEDGPSFGEWFAVEDAVLRFVEALRSAVGSRKIVVREPVLGVPLPEWLPDFRNGTVVSLEQAARLLRAALRGVRIGCVLSLLADGSVLVGVDFDGVLRVDVDERHGLVLPDLLSEELGVVDQRPCPPPTGLQERTLDEDFWRSVRELLPERPDGLLVIERWAYGDWGETWYLAATDTLDQVRRAVRENSLVIVQDLPDFEEIVLAQHFDGTSALALDDLDLRCLPAAHGDGPDLRIRPLRGAPADPALWQQPIKLVSPSSTGHPPLLAAVAPGTVPGTAIAPWLAW